MEALLVIFLSLLITVHGIAEHGLHEKVSMLEELENFDIYEEDEDEIEDLGMSSWSTESTGHVLVNVDSFGAVGDGVTDDTQVILK